MSRPGTKVLLALSITGLLIAGLYVAWAASGGDGESDFVLEINPPGATVICLEAEGSTTTYQATLTCDEQTPDPSHTVEIDFTGNTGDPGSGSNSASIDVPTDSAGEYTITAEAEDLGLSATATLIVVEVTGVTADKDAVCVGCDVTFEVTTNPDGHEDMVQWTAEADEGQEPDTQAGGKTFTTHWDTKGEKTVTASCGTSSKDYTVTVAELVSLNVDGGGDAKMLTGGLDYPQYKLNLVATVDPAVAGCDVTFAFVTPDENAASGATKAAILTPLAATTDAAGNARVEVTSGDLIGHATVRASCGCDGSFADKQVHFVGVDAWIEVDGENVTSHGHTSDKPKVFVAVDEEREVKLREVQGAQGEKTKKYNGCTVTAEIVDEQPEDQGPVAQIANGTTTINAEGELTEAPTVTGCNPGTFRFQFTIQDVAESKGPVVRAKFKTDVFAVASVRFSKTEVRPGVGKYPDTVTVICPKKLALTFATSNTGRATVTPAAGSGGTVLTVNGVSLTPAANEGDTDLQAMAGDKVVGSIPITVVRPTFYVCPKEVKSSTCRAVRAGAPWTATWQVRFDVPYTVTFYDQCQKPLGANWNGALVEEATSPQGTRESLASRLSGSAAQGWCLLVFGQPMSKKDALAQHFSKDATLRRCWDQVFFVDGQQVNGRNTRWAWAQWDANAGKNFAHMTNSVWELPK